SEVRVWRDPTMGEVRETESVPPELTPAQADAFDEIRKAIDEKRFASFLLHGVTGSGKTEVYLRAITRTLEQGRRALVLVPEIALTPQLLGRFRARFGADVAVLHSGLGRGERFDEWTRVRQGMVNVAVGARSAVFAPFEDVGLIVVDEEHDGGYKQEDKVRYNARD
ncbi:MAG: DEAD/DEAH box helicase family protein, partial [bacterium]|nr:DEAD/DEAH box helicase family protein [bacterium]